MKAQNIVKKYKVENLLELKIQPITQTIDEDKNSKSKAKKHPLKLELTHKLEAIYQEKEMMGWRSYVTNAPKECLQLNKPC